MYKRIQEHHYYDLIYELVFKRDVKYYCNSSSDTIINDMKEEFFGDNFIIKIKLLAKLLLFDSQQNYIHRHQLKLKYRDIIDYINHIEE